MKNTVIKMTAIASALLVVAGCNEKQAEEKPKEITLETMEQKVSYIFGFNTVKQIQSQDPDFILDSDIVSAAIKEVYEGKESRVSEEEIRATMMAFQAQLQEKRQSKAKQASEENAKKGEAFLAENAQKDGVITTESGLQYEVLTEGTGASPATTDKVKVNYKGTLIDGTVFDQGEGVEFFANRLIPSWVEALPLMKEGGKWKIVSPPNLAYGEGGTGSIPPNSTLVFEMELISIVKEEAKTEEKK